MPFEARVDPSIIFRSQDPLDEQVKGLSLRQGLREEQGALQDQKRQMALRQALSGADLGSPEGQQDAIGKVMRIDPNAGMKLQENFAKQQEQRQMGQLRGAQTQEAIAKTEDTKAQSQQREQENFATMLGAAAKSTESAWNTYQQDLKQYPKSIADANFRKVMGQQKELLENTYGPVAKKVTDKFDPETFMISDTPQQIQMMKGVAGKMAQQQQAAIPAGYQAGPNGSLAPIPGGPHDPTSPQAKAEDDRKVNLAAREAAARKKGEESAQGITADRVDMLEASYERDPTSLSRISTQERNAVFDRMKEKATAAGMTSDEYADKVVGQRGASKAAIKTETQFASGKQGDTVRSLNVADQHLALLDDLGKALKNHDIQLINKATNALGAATGNPNVTNFRAAKQIVADEVLKAVIGSGAGSLADREDLQKQFSEANTPEQMEGVIKTARGLMLGQLKGLKQQYISGGGTQDRWEQKVNPGTKERLESMDKSATAGKQSAPDSAIQHLKQHPELKDAFKSKYGYLPDGV